jgi:ribosomal protein S12 methylthiotransferase
MQNTKIGVISLGCDKNLVDTENMLYYITEAGYSLTNNMQEADVIIVNTCAFIDKSKKESIDTILEAAAQKHSRKVKLIVTGCLPARYKSELESGFEEVDAFLGTDSYKTIADTIKTVLNDKKEYSYESVDGVRIGRVLSTPNHFCYLKIADGCDNHCTYCAIPKIRGRLGEMLSK